MAGHIEEKNIPLNDVQDWKLVSKSGRPVQAAVWQVRPGAVPPPRRNVVSCWSVTGVISLYLRTTIPCRRADRVMVSSSDSDEHSEPSEYPQREPPQSSLTRWPVRVMP